MEFGPLCYATAATFTVAYIQALVSLKKTFKSSFAYQCMMIFILREEKILDFSPAKNCTLNLEISIPYMLLEFNKNKWEDSKKYYELQNHLFELVEPFRPTDKK